MNKQEVFKEATIKLQEKQKALYEREPERKLYDEGKIGWNEYVKLSIKREEELRLAYQGNENYELYDAGLISYDEFLALEGK
ncbi:hypothetical protein ACMZ6Z_00150 [Streptococcus pluranimalium]|uniref:Uncharacterized protein n=1 Tax=Helcococcus bovis TaxID=3153252 RepID=A0ABW9F6S0_9FIRM|nr:hypothetical protein [Streptococcus agalactiae]HEM2695169.1 hypothetical protein [Streptococcus suis]KAF1268420.1 hypothetical protein B8V77_04365 [Streptococcus agalactiae]MCD0151844.1 hypothetical protein [Streptococcus agalactiae]RRA51991.1 hypothetical protein D5F80_10550 [Streptococcus agalactiae]HEM2709492.1 hypothetical protein [Streptococcus suis]